MPHTLVPSDRVEHVSVYCRDGTKLGSIERLMLDKASGAVAYAVIKTGGLLGSHHHCPIRWDALRFDPVRQVYQTDVTPEDLRAGPSELEEEAFDWGDRSRPHPHYWTVQGDASQGDSLILKRNFERKYLLSKTRWFREKLKREED